VGVTFYNKNLIIKRNYTQVLIFHRKGLKSKMQTALWYSSISTKLTTNVAITINRNVARNTATWDAAVGAHSAATSGPIIWISTST
jgi:hypothetical protein